MITDSLDLGGAETHVTSLSGKLAAMGHEVTVISGGGRLVHTLSSVRHITLPYFKKRFLPYLFFKLWRFFRKNKFDVIHAHTRLSAFLCHPFAKGRLAVTAHWVFDSRFPKKQFTYWGNQTLAVSRDIAEYLKDVYGCKEQRITVTVNGIDSEQFAPQKERSKKRRIVCCTRMDADRADAAFALLEAVKQLPQDKFSLTLIGDGDRFEELTLAYERLKKQAPDYDIRLLGGVADVASHLKDADIFVGVSRAALEGMSAGCAVILAGNEGYLSVFRPRNAPLAEESNFCCRGAEGTTVEKLVRDLSYLLRLSREELLKMGEANREYILGHYTVSRMAHDALSVYQRICMTKCVLCGYYGFENVGDTLLSKALTKKLAERGYERVLLLSAKKLSLRAIHTLLCGYDFFLGGGNLLQDATSHRSLSFYLFCALRARYVEIYGGLGPLSCEGKKRVRCLLEKTQLFHARTRKDAALAKALGAPHVRLSSDTALSLSFPKKEKGEKILLSLRAPAPDEEAAALAFSLSLCRRFGKERCFIFVMHPADRRFAKRVAALCSIPMFEGGVDRFLSMLAKCQAVISSRLHAGICALGMEIPFLLWEGEEKCRFFIEDIKATAKQSDFCALFSFSDRPSALPDDTGIKKARALMRARI